MNLDWISVAVLLGSIFVLTALVTLFARGRFGGSTKMAFACIPGIFAGIGGASHGPGEILQDDIAPEGIIIQAWPELTVLVGEPAMTIIPSLLVTGLLAIVSGLLVTIWAAAQVQRENGGVILILLSAVMLFFGGGLFPPVIGIIAGIISIWAKRSELKNTQRLHE